VNVLEVGKSAEQVQDSANAHATFGSHSEMPCQPIRVMFHNVSYDTDAAGRAFITQSQ